MEESFGTILGYINKIPVYSCNYNNIKPSDLINLNHIDNITNIYYGQKYQCVELIRRWLIKTYNMTFTSINTADEIFNLNYLINVNNQKYKLWISINNNSCIKPTIGGIIIWDKSGNFINTGHVALITNIIGNYIYIVEQNNKNIKWNKNCNWSRILLLTFTNNIYTIHDKNENILGWKIL